jgi:hypothetical protein
MIAPHAGQGSKRVIVPVEVVFDGRSLGQFREAMVVLHPIREALGFLAGIDTTIEHEPDRL